MNKETPATPRKRTADRPAKRWVGALEGMHEGMLYGWAIDTEQPDARVVLEIHEGDVLLCCVIADFARGDLGDIFTGHLPNAPLPDHCHGFAVDLGLLAPHSGGVLTARVANTGIALAGAIDRRQQAAPPQAATNMVFSDGALRLHGWARDAANAQRVLRVRAYLGHRLIAEVRADQEHPGLRSHQVGARGFTLDLPLELADGRVHSVRVVDELGHPLNGSPLSVCSHAGGIRALLPQADDALLGNLIDVYERLLPRSLGLSQYAAWSERFETGTLAPTALRTAIIIAGDDAAAIERTEASLRRLEGAPMHSHAGQPFDALVRQALDGGADIIACVRAGDTLPPHALVHALEGFFLDGAQLVYTDSEHAGRPWFKPAWNPDYALTSDYPLDLMLYRRATLQADVAAHGLPADAASLGWRMLAAVWRQGQRGIVHVPRVLCHVHAPLAETERAARDAAAAQALHSLEPQARLTPLPPTASAVVGATQAARRLQRPLSDAERATPVTLIIPTRDHVAMLERCLDSIERMTDWPALEIIVIDNGSSEAASKTYFRKIAKRGVRVLPMPGPFNYADLNNRAVEAASGDIVGLVNNDIEALHAGWLDELVGQLLRPGVGAVGAKLLWPNGMVQHGGVLLGVGNVAGHYGNRLADADWGDHGRNQLVQQVSGVTAACLLLRKEDYLAVGGMDTHAFPVAFNDVDLCLKLRRAGKAIVWTPHARLLHAESASRGHEDTPQKRARAQREIDLLRQRWGAVLLRDPAYHPSLNLDPHSHAFGGLALPPRPRTPRLGTLDE